MKPDHVWKFLRVLHGRGVTLTSLAKELQTSHGHLSEVINGKRGAHTRKHIAKLLTEEETTILGWTERGSFVPRGTLSQVENLPQYRFELAEGRPA